LGLFDIENLKKSVYEVGVLSRDVINLLNLSLDEMPILFGDDRIKYVSKHAHEFPSYKVYKDCLESIHTIISEPDYVALHPKGQSIEYIKQLDELVLVAVRIKSVGSLWVRSFYPITKSKLNRYISEGTAQKLPQNS